MISIEITAVGDARKAHHRPPPIDIPPGGVHTVRLVHRAMDSWACGRAEIYTALDVRVRVGAFTQNEMIPFGAFALQILRNCD